MRRAALTLVVEPEAPLDDVKEMAGNLSLAQQDFAPLVSDRHEGSCDQRLFSGGKCSMAPQISQERRSR